MALEDDQTVLPARPVLLAGAGRTVPVEQREVALQNAPDLHLPLCRAAGVENVDHHCQALQGQPYDPGVLGFR